MTKSTKSILWLFGFSGIISISLSLMNKSLSATFQYPFTVALVQNLSACACTTVMISSNPDILRPISKSYIPFAIFNTGLFVFALWLALVALKTLPLPMYAVNSNLRPLCAGILEYYIQGSRKSFEQILALVLIALGALVSTFGMFGSEYYGFMLAITYTMTVSFSSVFENTALRQVRGDQTAVGLNFHRLVLSIPMLSGLIYVFEDYSSISDNLSQPVILLLACSGFMCLFAGIVMYKLQEVTTSTNIQVSGCLYKFITTVASLGIHGEYPTSSGWVGYTFSTLGFLMYCLT